MAERRLRKIDRLQQELAASGGSIAEITQIAISLKYMQGRYLARPAAELLVERGDPEAAQLSAGLAATPVYGREPHGDLLRAAFKKALATEGIPADVEANARAWYAHRGDKQWRKRSSKQQAQPPSDDWIATSDTGGLMGMIRRIFGRS
jgi:hypothetical protein